MIKDYILEEHRELTKKFNEGIDFDFYELGEHIKDSLYYSHILDQNGFWYIVTEILEENVDNVFLNVRRDYIKQELGIYENKFMSLLKNNKIKRFCTIVLLDCRFENNIIVEYLAEEYIIYCGVKYRITTYCNESEKICLDIAKL